MIHDLGPKCRNPYNIGERWRGFRSYAAMVICTLAIYYLSRRGGGIRTLEPAHQLLQERVPAASAWDRNQHHRLIRDLVARYGPLTAA